MDVSVILAIVSSILFVFCGILLLHHAYSHRAGGPHPLAGCDQFFQTSDICNFHSCSHEMWILGIALVVLVFAACALGLFYA